MAQSHHGEYAALIIGAGDVGKRIIRQLLASGTQANAILACVGSPASCAAFQELGVKSAVVNLDHGEFYYPLRAAEVIYYLVPPQKHGLHDLRTEEAVRNLSGISVEKVVVVSTTGVYGDCRGEWITENTRVYPKTLRAQRRLDMEHQWGRWIKTQKSSLVILRTPGIYASNRLPVARIKAGIATLIASQCGYTNRIHADDLAQVAIKAASLPMVQGQVEVLNVSDGTPGTITEYLQAVAEYLQFPALPEVTLEQAQTVLSPSMLSYLHESRRINNEKMRTLCDVQLRYPDFREGLRH